MPVADGGGGLQGRQSQFQKGEASGRVVYQAEDLLDQHDQHQERDSS
ncbi:MAG: hypothetical protein ACREWG_01985 [Gammaproteobacteria bacterium]